MAAILGVGAFAVGGPAIAQDRPATAMVSTLLSGNFDDYLMVAANHTANVLSGYYNDGKCRFAFHGALTPVEQYQRRDFGESYEIESWDPRRPERTFVTIIYSRARGGYSTQLTLEPGQRDINRPQGCRWRITLDRMNWVSESFLEVRVVRESKASVFDIKRSGEPPTLPVPHRHLPPEGSGVWVAKTYSAAYTPKGFVYLNWYDPPGTPRGGYVRDHALYSRSRER